MAIIRRFSTIRQGGIVFTGNTAGLSPVNATGGQIAGSIAVFTSLNTALQVAGYPAGTTLSYALNGSAAQLALPAGATVIHAELIWGGLFRSSTQDLSAITDNAVTFGTPQQTASLTGDPLTGNNLLIPANGTTLGFYTRTADVTSYVAAAGSGTYSLSAIPALIANPSSQSSDTNHAGWTLAVIYEDLTQPLRNLTLWCGASAVSLDAGSTDIAVSGFLTPDSLPIGGKLFVSAQEGDAVINGDSMLFGPNAASLQALSGPNNPTDNFFASQINNSAGTLDTSGTFGSRNASAAAGTNTPACRQGWDITAVDVSARLTPAQNAALIRLTTTGDLYVANAVALQVDSKGAILTVGKSADVTFVYPGGEAEYTLEIANSGTTSATDVVVFDPTPEGLEFVTGSLAVNGVPQAGEFPVSLPDIPAGGSVTVTYRLRAVAVPAVNPAVNEATVNYNFSPFAGIVVSASAESPPVELTVIFAAFSAVKSVDKNFALSGEELTYVSVVTNTGNTDADDVVFTDVPPSETTFVAGSVTVDGIPAPTASPADGIPLGAIARGASRTVAFKVTIN